MAANNGNRSNRSIVVLQLSGGNDYLNTVVPFENGLYYDNRPTVHVAPDQVLDIGGGLGFRPQMVPIKRLWDEGKVAVINGIGYPNPNRSHFRSMDIWHTALPDDIGQEGWLGRVIRELDPKGDNVLTGVNFGRGLPRALGLRGVPVASVGNLDTYGLFPDIQDEALRKYALDAFAMMYGGARGKDAVMDFLGQTGLDALRGADILRTAPAKYSSSIEYADNPIAQSMRSVAQVMFADLGTRVYYTQHGSFDTHSGEVATHATLWSDVAGAVGDFMDDVRSTTARTTWCSSCSPSSAAASRTTAAAATTAPAASPSSSATTSRAGCTASTRRSSSSTSWRATSTSTTTSAAPTRPSWSSGSISKPHPSSTAASRPLT